MEVWASEMGLSAEEFLPLLKGHFDVESIDGISQLRHLSLHDYGEEDEPDFSMGQKQRLHDAVMKTAPELLARLGGRAADEAKDELRLRRD
jgi:hypothetical protein